MSAILRQSSVIARLSRSSLQSASRSSLRTSNHTSLTLSSRLAIRQARSFASKPSAPKKGGEKKDESAKVNGKATTPPSKSAPGTENLYDGKGPLSPGSEKAEASEAPLSEGMTKISPEEEKKIEELLETLKKGLPASQVAVIERAFESIKKEGVPKELME